MLLWMLQVYPNIHKAVICDINHDLIQTWRSVAENPADLIKILQEMQNEYYALEHDEDRKKEYFYKKRDIFNARDGNSSEQSALFIFLNRTCFNGLYRVNRQNFYNVPIGSYKKPCICDAQNIIAVSHLIKKVEIVCADFEDSLHHAQTNSLFYLDPPYKPLSSTSSFTAYANNAFDDAEQIRLQRFCQKLDEQQHQWLLSNSDHVFFDEIYMKFKRQRVKARRNINAKHEGRGVLTELLMQNY